MGSTQSSSSRAPPAVEVPLGGGKVHRPDRPPVSAMAALAAPRCPGLKNYDNSCFVNATIQLLYHCQPFRAAISDSCGETSGCSTAGASSSNGEREHPSAAALPQLFAMMDGCSKSALSPKSFLNKVREEYDFPKGVHQDAHDFLSRILNGAIDRQRKALGLDDAASQSPLQRLLEGTLHSAVTCLDCGSSTSSSEPFPCLSLEIDQDASLVSCLRRFLAPELLSGAEKFKCECCCASACAQKGFQIARAPELLLVQLKRFHFNFETNVHKKLFHRVSLPHWLGVRCADDTNQCPGLSQYRLRGFVVHHGPSLSFGHYYACVRCSDERWRCFDDDQVTIMAERDLVCYFGLASARTQSHQTATAYLLLYERDG